MNVQLRHNVFHEWKGLIIILCVKYWELWMVKKSIFFTKFDFWIQASYVQKSCNKCFNVGGKEKYSKLWVYNSPCSTMPRVHHLVKYSLHKKSNSFLTYSNSVSRKNKTGRQGIHIMNWSIWAEIWITFRQ